MNKRKSLETDAGPSKKGRYLTDHFHTPAGLKVPSVIAASKEIVDRDSFFIANAASVTSDAQAAVFRRHVREAHR